MKRTIISVSTALLCSVSMNARHIGSDQIEGIVRQFVGSHTSFTQNKALKNVEVLKVAYHSAEDELRVYNVGNNAGYVIVSGDDAAYPVLGYSTEGNFDYDTLPDHARSWIDSYISEIGYAAMNELDGGAISEERVQPVAPILGSLAWDQTAPFNNLCPKYYGNQRAATGCVATAMAMIMYHHQYPATGAGATSYSPQTYTSIGTLSVDFSQSHYNWGAMQLRYDSTSSDEACEAVAKLMFDCGVAVHMEYGPNSGAMSKDWCRPLVENFLYDCGVAYRWRSYYSINEWNSLIREELYSGRPVFFTGYTDEGGHAFVCDGLDADGLMHINWGWTGMSNGYFRTTALTPASQGTGGSTGGFNYKQQIITGIMPPVEGSEPDIEIVSEEAVTASKSKWNKEQPVTLKLNGRVQNVGWQDAKCVTGWLVCPANDPMNVTKVISGANEVTIAEGAYARNLSFPQADMSDVADGEYYIYPAVCNPGGTKWMRIRDMDLSYPNYALATVSGDNVTIATPSEYALAASDVTVEGELMSGINTRISVMVENIGESEYSGKVKASLLDAATKRRITDTEGYLIDLMPGESTEVEIIGSFTASAGEYLLAITDDSGVTISTTFAVTLSENPGASTIEAAEQFGTTEGDELTTDNVHFTAKIRCTKGVFAGDIFVYIYDADGNTMGCLDPTFTRIDSGETRDVTVTGRFENGQPGVEYRASLVNGLTNTYITPKATAQCYFTLKENSGIRMETALQEDKVEFFTLLGSPAGSSSEKLTPGVYIMRKGNSTSKIIKY